MSSRGRPLERTRSIEDLHELRLMALLHDLVRKHQRKGAGEMLGVDPRTVKACLEQGALSKWMRTALEAQLLSREKAAMRGCHGRDDLDQRPSAYGARRAGAVGIDVGGAVRRACEAQKKAEAQTSIHVHVRVDGGEGAGGPNGVLKGAPQTFGDEATAARND